MNKHEIIYVLFTAIIFFGVSFIVLNINSKVNDIKKAINELYIDSNRWAAETQRKIAIVPILKPKQERQND